jgi:hypothetical protein
MVFAANIRVKISSKPLPAQSFRRSLHRTHARTRPCRSIEAHLAARLLRKPTRTHPVIPDALNSHTLPEFPMVVIIRPSGADMSSEPISTSRKILPRMTTNGRHQPLLVPHRRSFQYTRQHVTIPPTLTPVCQLSHPIFGETSSVFSLQLHRSSVFKLQKYSARLLRCFCFG